MKNFILIMVYMSAFAVNAQTTIVKKYPNDMLDTVWHLRNLDTFLIENYRPNGHLRLQVWRNDSAYSYDNQKNIIEKKYYFKDRQEIISFNSDRDLNEIANVYYKHQVFYPNGNIASQAYWTGDTLWQQVVYEVNGTISKQNIFKKTSPFVFEWVVQNENYKSVSVLDTLHLLGKIFWYDKDGRMSAFVQYQIKSFYDIKSPEQFIQYIQYDSLGKKKFEWHSDSNQVIPFKDNGLCLYGFVNLKGDTLAPAQYEGVEKIGSIFNQHYIVHTSTAYSVLDALGNTVIAPNWIFLDVFKSSRITDSLMEQTYLRCRTKTGFGIMRLNGQMILQPVYQDIRHYKNDLFEVKIGGSWGIVDANGQVLVTPLYPHLAFTEQPDLYLVEELVHTEYGILEQYSLIRQDGRVLLNPLFSSVDQIENRYFRVKSLQDQAALGIFHPEKGWIYDTLYSISSEEGRYLVLDNLKTEQSGLIDCQTMQPILPFIYQSLNRFVSDVSDATVLTGVRGDTFYIAEKDNKYGVFNPRTRKWVLPLEYDFFQSWEYRDSFFITLKNGLWAIRNLNGQIIDNQTFTHFGKSNKNCFGQRGDSVLFFTRDAFPVPVPMGEVADVSEKLIQFYAFGGKQLIVNLLQKIAVPMDLQIISLDGHYAVVRDTLKQLQFVTDHQGKRMTLLPQLEVLQLNMDKNIMIVFDSTTQKLGAMRKDGSFILKPNYFALFSLDSANVLWAKKDASPPLSGTQKQQNDDDNEFLGYKRDTVHKTDKGWAMYDNTGRLLTNTLFEYAFQWHHQVGIGLVNGKFGLWHASGKNLVPPNYDKIWYDNINEIYHLFEFPTKQQQLVGFANKQGTVIADGLFKKMSAFNGEYAFVETLQGLGIVSRTGKYLVEPKPYSIQQSVLNLMPTMDSLTKRLQLNFFHFFSLPYDTVGNGGLSPFKKVFNTLSVENQLLINNLLIESIAPNFFLLPERISYDRTSLHLHSLSETDDAYQKTWFSHISNHLVDPMVHVDAVAVTQKYINFSLNESNLAPFKVSEPKSLHFKRANGYWEKIKFDNLLNINDKNKALFLKLFAQKLSALKNANLDCSDPSKYIAIIKENFYVLDEGMQFQIFTPTEATPISISFSWAELKPFLSF
jgi:WG containing repeat